MQILHLNTHDIRGGASRAAYRLHKQLRIEGIDSQFLVQHKHGTDPSVSTVDTKLADLRGNLRSRLDALPLKKYPNREGDVFSPGLIGKNITDRVEEIDPDIVHLHWISEGFVSLDALSNIDIPIIWTLHDMWAFTGGCHYSNGCTRYQDTCGECPYLNSKRQNDLSKKVLERKAETLSGVDLSIVTPSKWLANKARESILEEKSINVIPNGIDTDQFSPRDREKAQRLYNLPKNKQLILFGAFNTTNPRKGAKHLEESLRGIDLDGRALIMYGHGDLDLPLDEGSDVTYVGHVDDAGLALLYAAADVFIVPSIEDNLPNTILEALSCGTPCVAFDIGGIPDMITHKKNGYLAEPFNPDDFGNGIEWALDNENNQQKPSINARMTIENEFDIKKITKKYHNMYSNNIYLG